MSIWFKFFNQLLYKRVIYSFKMPFCVIVNHTTKKASIIDDWKTAESMVSIIPDAYLMKFDTLLEAEKHIKDVKCELSGSSFLKNHDTEEPNEQNSLKRKRELESDELIKHTKSVVKDQIKKIKMSFNALQISIAHLQGLSATCAEQIQTLNDKVAYKLSEILKVKKPILLEDVLEDASSNIKQIKQEIENQEPSNQNHTAASSSSSSSTLQPPETSVPQRSIPESSALSTWSREISDFSQFELQSATSRFSLNDKGEVIVYSDGACFNNGSNKASAGVGVWFGCNHPLNASLKVPGVQTNNNAEIYAVIKAIERVKATGILKVNVRSDSDFTVKSVKIWMPKWLTNGWKTADGRDVKNKEMFLELNKRIKEMEKVNMTYVPAHKGVTGNEEADKLAKLAAKK